MEICVSMHLCIYERLYILDDADMSLFVCFSCCVLCAILENMEKKKTWSSDCDSHYLYFPHVHPKTKIWIEEVSRCFALMLCSSSTALFCCIERLNNNNSHIILILYKDPKIIWLVTLLNSI